VYINNGDRCPKCGSVVAIPGGGEDQGGTCLVATAAFASPHADEVWVLRAFRDRVLLPSAAGRRLVRHYYRISPTLAVRISRTPLRRALVRQALRPVVRVCRLLMRMG